MFCNDKLKSCVAFTPWWRGQSKLAKHKTELENIACRAARAGSWLGPGWKFKYLELVEVYGPPGSSHPT